MTRRSCKLRRTRGVFVNGTGQLVETSPWYVKMLPLATRALNTAVLVFMSPGGEGNGQTLTSQKEGFQRLLEREDAVSIRERPGKGDDGQNRYHVYETQRSRKAAVGLVSGPLPYFGVTLQAAIGSPGRYSNNREESQSLMSIGIAPNKQTAFGAESLLIMLNTPQGMTPAQSPYIDNAAYSTTNATNLTMGAMWLETIDPNWQQDFNRRDNVNNSPKEK